MTTVVEAQSLTKRFGEVSAVTDLSFVLQAGTITGFLGPNGAGYRPIRPAGHQLTPARIGP
jgi:ABC-type multidrug transport system ATPase subunit